MKYLKRFNESTSNERPSLKFVVEYLKNNLNKDIDQLGLLKRIKINNEGLVDFDGEIILNVREDRLPIKFGKVNGPFVIYSKTMTTLEGSPHTCESFRVNEELPIENLIGCPKFVNDVFWVAGTPITSLEGSPETVYHFNCSETLINTLEGGPRYVKSAYGTELGGIFNCSNTPITNLVGSPEVIEGPLIISQTNLTSLEGIPKRVEYIVEYGDNRDKSKIWDPRPLKYSDVSAFHPGKNSPLSYLMKLFTSSANIPIGDQELEYKLFRDSLDYNYVRGTTEDPQINLFRLREAFDEFEISFPRGDPNEVFGGHYRLVDDNGRSVDFQGKPIGIFKRFFGF